MGNLDNRIIKTFFYPLFLKKKEEKKHFLFILNEYEGINA